MTDIPISIKKQIVKQEMEQWEVTRYQLEVRHRVNKRIGSSADVMKSIETDLERCEKAIDALSDEMKLLDESASADAS